MSTITTRITVAEDGRISSGEPLPPGEHLATIAVDGRPPVQKAAQPFDIDAFPRLNLGPWPWPEGTTFSRDEIYGDDGR